MPGADALENACPINESAPSFWDALPYVYLLRIQIITFLALVCFPFIALYFAPNLLRGIFDVSPLGMFFVAISAILATWTVKITTRQVLLYGPERFHIRPLPFRLAFLTELPSRVGVSSVFAIFALPSILAAMYVSKDGGTSTYLHLLPGVLIGALFAAIILRAGEEFRRRGWSQFKPVTKFLTFFGPGFESISDSAAHEGHYMALWSFFLCFLIYVAIGIGKFFRIGHPATVPTLADLLVFLMILCWGLSAVTFILDRFRVPLLLPFLLAAICFRRFLRHRSLLLRASTQRTLPCSLRRTVIRAGKPGAQCDRCRRKRRRHQSGGVDRPRAHWPRRS